MSSLQIAFNHHRQGQLDEASAAYEAVLAEDANQTQALLMLGIIALEREHQAQAEDLLARLLVLEPANPLALHQMGRLKQGRGEDETAIDLFERAAQGKPDLAPIFNDWAVSLNRLGQRQQALTQLDQALTLDPDYAVAHDNRGLVLYDLQAYGDAAQAHFMALAKTPVQATPARVDILLHLAYAATEAQELAAAERACRAVMALDRANTDAIDQLAKILDRQLRDDEAKALRNDLARSQGLRRAGNPTHPKATILLLGGVGAGHVPTRYLFDPKYFATLSMSMVSPDQPDAPLGTVTLDQLSDCDLIFNCLGEVEKLGGQVEPLKALVAGLKIPVLNDPDTVLKTGRDTVPALFAGIKGLVVPSVRRAARLDITGSAPTLVRPAGAHGGKDLALITSPSEAEQYLAKVPYEHFLFTDFHDFKSADGLYRKYRFIFVDRKPYAYHLAIADDWLVHYWRAEMSLSPWKKAEEERFMADWPTVFGSQGTRVIEAVAQALDLDYGGMDCALLPDGGVLFFEANATMLLHLDDNPIEFPYKHRYVPLIREAITTMVLSRL